MFNSSMFSYSSTSEVLLKLSRIINIARWFLSTVRIIQKIRQDWNMQLKFHKFLENKVNIIASDIFLFPLLKKSPKTSLFWIMNHPVIRQKIGGSYWGGHPFLYKKLMQTCSIVWSDELWIFGEVALSCY